MTVGAAHERTPGVIDPEAKGPLPESRRKGHLRSPTQCA